MGSFGSFPILSLRAIHHAVKRRTVNFNDSLAVFHLLYHDCFLTLLRLKL
jgi:hypothetical protein